MYFPNKKNRLTQAVAMLLAVLTIMAAITTGQPAYAASNANTGTVATASAASGTTGEPVRVSYTKNNYPDLKDVGYGTYRTLDYKEAEGKTTYLYDFRKTWNAASTTLEEKYAISTAINKNIGFYGVTASAEKNVVTYEIYTELENVVVNGAEFRTYDDAKYNVVDAAPGEHTLNVAKLPNGPYSLCVWFDYELSDGTIKTLCAWSAVYVSNGEAWFAQHTSLSDSKDIKTYLADKRNDLAADDAFQAWMAKHGGNDLEAALKLDGVAYPFYSNTSRYPNHTSKWQALAHEICPDEDASDFRKAYLLHDWMANNLVYDKAHLGKEYRYATIANATTWETHLGKCVDFANIYAIMCRELDVPCRLVSDTANNHVYNAVYLNGRWELIDVTDSVDSKKVGDSTAEVNTFWDSWDGNTAARASAGFLVSAAGKFKIHSYETDKYKTIEDRLGKLNTTLDNSLSTKEYIKRCGGIYNH